MIFRQTCSHLLSYNLIAKGFTTVLWIVTVTLMNPLLAISGDTETNRQNLQARQLFELSNNELIEQARTIFDEASGKSCLTGCPFLLDQITDRDPWHAR